MQELPDGIQIILPLSEESIPKRLLCVSIEVPYLVQAYFVGQNLGSIWGLSLFSDLLDRVPLITKKGPPYGDKPKTRFSESVKYF
uniref:Uncharacterized protein n=1 Tax=Anguilla anguilla TaxID=7936 RepID=A0A0E9SDK7_ANGAN